MNDKDSQRGGNAGQLVGAIHLGIVNVEPDGNTASSNGLAEAVEQGIESLAGIELGMGNQPAGIIQYGIEEALKPSPFGSVDVGPEHHIGLPDLVGKLGLELLVSGGFRTKQLLLGEAASFDESIQGLRRNRRLSLGETIVELPQNGGSSEVRIFCFEPFDGVGQF